MRYKLNSKSSKIIPFDLLLVCDKDGKKIPTPITIQRIDQSSGIVYLQKGVYGYKSRGLSIFVRSGLISVPVKVDSPVDLTENIPQDFTWEVNESDPNSQEIKPDVKCSAE